MAAQANQPPFDAPTSDWLVYADALQEAHDPRGELITLNHAVESGKTKPEERDAYVTKHAVRLLGEGIAAESYRIGWRHCLIDSVEILIDAKSSFASLIDALVASPCATNVRSIALVGVGTVDLTPAMAALVTKLPKSCTSVAFIDDRAAKTTMLASRDFEPNPNLVTVGPLKAYLDSPQVEHLKLSVADAEQLDLGNLKAPNLKSFTLHCLRYGGDPFGDEEPAMSERLASASWPKLEALEVRLAESYFANIIADEDAYVSLYAKNDRFEKRMDEAEDGENEGMDWSNLNALLQSLKKTPLKRLALVGADTASSLLDTIADAGLPSTLEELDLSDSSVSEAEWFIKNKEIIAPLKRLVLERTSMTTDEAKKLATLGPEIKHTHGAGARFRYVVGSE